MFLAFPLCDEIKANCMLSMQVGSTAGAELASKWKQRRFNILVMFGIERRRLRFVFWGIFTMVLGMVILKIAVLLIFHPRRNVCNIVPW